MSRPAASARWSTAGAAAPTNPPIKHLGAAMSAMALPAPASSSLQTRLLSAKGALRAAPLLPRALLAMLQAALAACCWHAFHGRRWLLDLHRRPILLSLLFRLYCWRPVHSRALYCWKAPKDSRRSHRMSFAFTTPWCLRLRAPHAPGRRRRLQLCDLPSRPVSQTARRRTLGVVLCPLSTSRGAGARAGAERTVLWHHHMGWQ